MIPCRDHCPAYCEGCHKDCTKWKEVQQRCCEERQKKKAYLNYYRELCSQIVRQCRVS